MASGGAAAEVIAVVSPEEDRRGEGSRPSIGVIGKQSVSAGAGVKDPFPFRPESIDVQAMSHVRLSAVDFNGSVREKAGRERCASAKQVSSKATRKEHAWRLGSA